MALTPDERKLALQKEMAGLSNPPGSTTTATFVKQELTDNNLDDQNITTNSIINTSNILPNLLNVYTSYTSLISLQVTTPQLHAKMVQSQTYIPDDWSTICQSGGVGANRVAVNGTQFFVRDLFIDNFEMQTILGQNQENRGSNATEISFTINEPNGMDLIEELYDYCKAIGEYNYCQLPYLLKIFFKGYKDDGTATSVPGTTKYIPIILTNIEIKANNTGAIYTVTAIPINEMGLTEAAGRIDSTIETTGNTVQDFCNAISYVLNKHQKEYVSKQIYAVEDQYEITCLPQISTEISNGNIDIGSNWVINPVYSNTTQVPKDAPMGEPSSTDNHTNLKALASNWAQYLGNSNTIKTTVTTANNSSNISSVSGSETTETTTNGSTTFVNKVWFNANGTSSGHNIIRFNAGSSILDCLNTLLISSKYITDQIEKFEKKVKNIVEMANSIGTGASDNVGVKEAIKQLRYPFLWFTITPVTTLLGYDNIREKYAAKYQYLITPYIIDNAKIMNVPNQYPELRVIKKYDYILTGKNTEILTFDLDFKTVFLTYAQTNKDTKQQGTGASSPADTDTSPQNTYSVVNSGTIISAGHFTSASPNSPKTLVSTGDQTHVKNSAADVASTIYAPAEMLSINLNVNGDPDYIRQDGIFLLAASGNTLEPYHYESTGSPAGIMFNSGEIYMELNFLIPRDLDQSSGTIVKLDLTDKVQYKRNMFSGYFRVLTASNKINHGVFTQELQAIRFNDSHEVELKSSTNNSSSGK